MSKYLVIGLENSTTKNMSKIIAQNLKIKNCDSYDGNYELKDESNHVKHISYPYGECRPKNSRNHYPKVTENEYDFIVICIRDFYCSRRSKQASHQPDKKLCDKEHEDGKFKLQKIASYSNSYFFSYEAWFILGDIYMEKFLNSIDINYKVKTIPLDINSKHIK